MKQIKDIKEYQIIENKDVPDINSTGYLLKHKKTGAKILILSNDDNNKVFSVSFRTPPYNDTGLPHILEHSVLCGSDKFPAKDPFVELVKGSLNTFLNAMTFPDKTMYPIASCNDKDFQNLMHVYMDAVFYPNIYKKEEIFRQEGWSYQLEEKDGAINYNGVVYNEMKGAFSSPDGILEREILHSLYPDTCYGFESGGDPLSIPELTYEEFLDFHRKYYHPSNSYIYLYGDMDIAEKLEWLDKEYLGKFDSIEIDSAIKMQPEFNETTESTIEYPISEDEDEVDNTYLSYNMVLGDNLDKEKYIAFQIIEYALFSMPGAPVKQKLLDAGIGKDINSTYDNGLLQPYLAVTAKYANAGQKDEFISILKNAFEEIAENGFNERSLIAALNAFEFKFREADFGTYPKGLIYGMQVMDSWLYDENLPFMHIEASETFEFLRKQIGTGYYKELVKKYLVENTHSSIVILVPKKGMTVKNDRELGEKLDKYKAGLSNEQIEALVESTKSLKEYQEEPSTKEELESIPLLSREDIEIKPRPFKFEEKEVDGLKVVWQDYFTSGIAYVELLFNANGIKQELIPYLGFLKAVLGYMDTKKHGYVELSNEINIHTGEISAGTSTFLDAKDRSKYYISGDIKVKMLYEEIPAAIDLIEEIVFTTIFDDEKRLYEIISELKSRLQSGLNAAGHSAAALRSMSYYSETAYIREQINGITFFKLVEDLEKNFKTKKDELIGNLYELMKQLLHKDALTISITADQNGYDLVANELKNIAAKIPGTPKPGNEHKFEMKKSNEGFKSSSQVQYVSRAGNFKDAGFEYTGVLKVLRVIMNYEYLWTNIRVKGGAYGCMSAYTRSGDTYFVSYRDPNLKKTNEIFNGIADFVNGFDVDERDMTKYVIGTISDLDTPLTPQLKGARALSAYFTGIDYEQLCKERLEVINAKKEDVRSLAPLLKSVLEQNNLCAIGNEGKIAEDKDLFGEVKNLFN